MLYTWLPSGPEPLHRMLTPTRTLCNLVPADYPGARQVIIYGERPEAMECRYCLMGLRALVELWVAEMRRVRVFVMPQAPERRPVRLPWV